MDYLACNLQGDVDDGTDMKSKGTKQRVDSVIKHFLQGFIRFAPLTAIHNNNTNGHVLYSTYLLHGIWAGEWSFNILVQNIIQGVGSLMHLVDKISTMQRINLICILFRLSSSGVFAPDSVWSTSTLRWRYWITLRGHCRLQSAFVYQRLGIYCIAVGN